MASVAWLANVTINQGSADVDVELTQKDRLHGYYVVQKDLRQEPTAGGAILANIPGFGDTRSGRDLLRGGTIKALTGEEVKGRFDQLGATVAGRHSVRSGAGVGHRLIISKYLLTCQEGLLR